MSPHDRCGEIWNFPLMACVWCRKCSQLCKIYVLSCGEKLSPKVHLWRKMTNIRSALHILNYIIFTYIWIQILTRNTPEFQHTNTLLQPVYHIFLLDVPAIFLSVAYLVADIKICIWLVFWRTWLIIGDGGPLFVCGWLVDIGTKLIGRMQKLPIARDCLCRPRKKGCLQLPGPCTTSPDGIQRKRQKTKTKTQTNT